LRDVGALGALVATAQEHHESGPAPDEVEAKAWSVVNAKLQNAPTNRLYVRGEASLQPDDTLGDPSRAGAVSQRSQPTREDRRLAHLDHV